MPEPEEGVMPDDPKPDDPKPDEDVAGLKKALDAERKLRREADRRADAAETRATTAEAELQKLQDDDKSESDKLREEIETLKADNAERDAKALRAEVALAKGLSAAQAKRLQGTTREELEADADEIVETFGTGSKGGDGGTPPPSKKPAADLRGGSDPTEEPDEKVDPEKLADLIPRP